MSPRELVRDLRTSAVGVFYYLRERPDFPPDLLELEDELGYGEMARAKLWDMSRRKFIGDVPVAHGWLMLVYNVLRMARDDGRELEVDQVLEELEKEDGDG